MGLFDFLKKKEMPENKTQINTSPEEESYLGDLEKTNRLHELVQTPKSERDHEWEKSFLENIQGASFRSGEPQVITGPDGFPYFQLFLPEPNQSFQCYVIQRMKDDFLLKSGLGVVINPTSTGADWVLTYGDILNLHLNESFYTDIETPFSKKLKDEIISEDENVMIGQPSESLLPIETRHVISEYLKAAGIQTPKILLMMRNRQDGKDISQYIVFNLTPADFKDQLNYEGVMKTISWYLPRHYSFMGMDEKNLTTSFMPL